MTRSAWIIALMLVGAAFGARPVGAQSLNAQQKLGRQLFTQSCLECHAKPQLGSAMYGPALSKESGNGDAAVMKGVIRDGTPRMPAFKYQFTAKQIDAIVAYLGTVPKPVAAAGGGNKGGMD